MGEKVPKEVDLGNVFKTEAKDPSMIAYLKSLGMCRRFHQDPASANLRS
jgi:hypothetical protein